MQLCDLPRGELLRARTVQIGSVAATDTWESSPLSWTTAIEGAGASQTGILRGRVDDWLWAPNHSVGPEGARSRPFTGDASR
jgi:hypothetical protein